MFDTTIPHTYDEWVANGYRVWKGQKMTGRNEQGVATFRPEQVVNFEQFVNDTFNRVMHSRIRELQLDYPH